MSKPNWTNVRNIRLTSNLLARETNYCAILPEKYENSAMQFPVLYLLHGLFGSFDNWLTNTNLVEYANDFPGIIICCDGGDNWYSDAPHLNNHFYESYVFDELFPAVENEFNVGRSRDRRAVGGLSMGGYGAFKFAFRQPEKFCFAASMSGAFHAAEIFADGTWTELQPSILNIFSEDNALRAANNLFQIIDNFDSVQITELPFFYFDCGSDDAFLPVNIKLAEIFQRREIAHDFQVFTGGHDWNYWNSQVKTLLRQTARFLVS